MRSWRSTWCFEERYDEVKSESCYEAGKPKPLDSRFDSTMVPFPAHDAPKSKVRDKSIFVDAGIIQPADLLRTYKDRPETTSRNSAMVACCFHQRKPTTSMNA